MSSINRKSKYICDFELVIIVLSYYQEINKTVYISTVDLVMRICSNYIAITFLQQCWLQAMSLRYVLMGYPKYGRVQYFICDLATYGYFKITLLYISSREQHKYLWISCYWFHLCVLPLYLLIEPNLRLLP